MYSPYLAVTLNLPAVVATSATAITTSGFTANWQSASGITEYQFDLSTGSSFSSFVPGYNALSVTGTSLIIAGLDFNTTYYYRLRAVYAGQTGPNSNTVIATTLNISAPDAPVNVTVSLTEGGLIRLDWQNDPTPGTTWNVYASDDPYSGYTLINTGVTTNYKVLDISEAAYPKRFYYVKAVR